MKVEQVDNQTMAQVARILLLLIYVLLVVEGEQVLMKLNPLLHLVQVLDSLEDLVEVVKVIGQQCLRMVLVDKEI